MLEGGSGRQSVSTAKFHERNNVTVCLEEEEEEKCEALLYVLYRFLLLVCTASVHAYECVCNGMECPPV